jgi:hypothetical protein
MVESKNCQQPFYETSGLETKSSWLWNEINANVLRMTTTRMRLLVGRKSETGSFSRAQIVI